MSALRIEIEDRGQDFLSFTLRNGMIEDANMQGFVWNGKKVANKRIVRGSIIRFSDGNALNYPVVKTTRIK